MGNVSVPRSYFVKTAVRDYNDPLSALVREFLQNSRDAGASTVAFTFTSDGSSTTLTVRDDGCGMTRDIIESKLMALGETTKGAEQTGGFGVAKILLFFAHESYSIRTNNLLVQGQGGSYSIEETGAYIKGVVATVQLSSEVISRSLSSLKETCRDEIRKSHLDMQVFVQDEQISTDSRKGRLVAEIGPGLALYKRRCDTTQYYASVRVNGLHMFGQYIGDTKYVLHVELTGYSIDYLTTNRDGLRGEWRQKVEKACQEFVLNTSQGNKTALKLYRGASSRFSEEKLQPLVDSVNEKVSALLSLATDNDSINEQVQKLVEEQLPTPELRASADKLLSSVTARLQHGWQNVTVFDAQLEHHYFVETNGNFRTLPAPWRPENFKKSQTQLLALWSKIVGMVLADAGKVGTEFNVGFLLDDGSEGDIALAKYRKRGDGTDLFLLNAQKYGDEKRLPIKRNRRTELVLWLLDLAVHEVTHSCDYALHNESFMKKENQIKQKALLRIKEYLSL